MANPTYRVVLREPVGGAKRAVFVGRGRYGPGTTNDGSLAALNFWRRLRTAGSFTLYIDGQDDRIAEFVDDAIVQIERFDVYSGAFVQVFEGLHASAELTMDKDGAERFISRGRGMNNLLAGEVILGFVGDATSLKSGASETVAKAYVNEAIGPGAGVDDLGLSRVRTGLTIEADAGTGAVWTGDRANSNLLDVLIEIANYAPGDFGIISGATPGTFQFVWRDVRWGEDRSKLNTGGNAPVIFSPTRRNVENISIIVSRLDEANVVYAIGQGAGDQRARVTVANVASLGASPLARRAVARDASDESTPTGLTGRGYDALETFRPVVSARFDAINTDNTEWIRDWDVGDSVTVEYKNISITQKIIGVRVTLDGAGSETVAAEAINE